MKKMTKEASTKTKSATAPSASSEKILKQALRQLNAEENDTSSDEEYVANTIGEEIPLEWYKAEFDHIGYNAGGQPIIPKGDGDVITRMLLARGENEESKEFRRSVYDERNDETTVLTDRELAMVKRIVSGKYVHAELDAEPDYVDWFSGEKLKAPLGGELHEPKSRFIPSKWERMKIEKIARGIREGTIKYRTEEEEQNDNKNKKKLYLLWGDDDAVENQDEVLKRKRKTGGGYIPAPKNKLPGHQDSYHPSPEYLTGEEKQEEPKQATGDEEEEEKEGKEKAIVKDFGKMRNIPAYANFVGETFERCLDLYLCPRTTKIKLNINPESLVPRLPLPRELRPFPTTQSITYIGHIGRIRSLSTDPLGEFVCTGGDDCSVKVWEVESGRCVWSHGTEGQPPLKVVWNPRFRNVIAVVLRNEIEFVHFALPSASGRQAQGENSKLEKTMAFFTGAERPAEETQSEKKHFSVKWGTDSSARAGAFERGDKITIRMTIENCTEILDAVWHGKGEYLATLSNTATKQTEGMLLVHMVPARQSVSPLAKSRDVQCVCFHPSKPIVFVATKIRVYVFHLVKKVQIKKLDSGLKWINSMAVHPSGDYVIVGSFDCRLACFDLNTSEKPFRTLKYHSKAIRSVCFHSHYPLMATASDDGTLNVFHITVYPDDLVRAPLIVPVKRIVAHDVVQGRGALDAKFHPQHPWIFSCGQDGLAVLFTNVP